MLRCHIEAFEHFGGVPREILYDRMKTAVLGEGEDERIVYNGKLLALGAHYGFSPRACQPYRAKTKGKVERPYRYIREDFFLARRFANLEDLNAQLQRWLDTVANARAARHHRADRGRALRRGARQPAARCRPVAFDAVLARAARQPRGHGLGGRQPLQRARRHALARGARCTRRPGVRILEDGAADRRAPAAARAPAVLGAAGTSQAAASAPHAPSGATGHAASRPGEAVARRALSFYEAVGKRLARNAEAAR